MDIIGNGYGGRTRKRETAIGARFEVELWRGEEYGTRTFTSVSGTYDYDTANRMVEEWAQEAREQRPAFEVVAGHWLY